MVNYREFSDSNQNPDLGYILLKLPGQGNLITPLLNGRYYIGRVTSCEELSIILQGFTGLRGWLCLPKGDEPRICIPAGWINVQENACTLHAGWPREYGETLFIQGISGETNLRNDEYMKLNGFERINFMLHPICTISYIPPISTYALWLTVEQVLTMETMKLWGSAGCGWARLGKLERAMSAFRNALVSPIDLDLHHRIQLLTVQTLRILGGAENKSLAEKYERQTLEYLKIPLFDINVKGKVFQYGEETILEITGYNLSRLHPATQVSIRWHCPELNEKSWFDIGTVRPRSHISPQRFEITSGLIGRFPVTITINYCDQDNIVREQQVIDYIKVRRPRLKAGGDAIVLSGFTDPDDIPDVAGDLVFINRISRKNPQIHSET